jgi:hypothetical protein
VWIGGRALAGGNQARTTPRQNETLAPLPPNAGQPQGGDQSRVRPLRGRESHSQVAPQLERQNGQLNLPHAAAAAAAAWCRTQVRAGHNPPSQSEMPKPRWKIHYCTYIHKEFCFPSLSLERIDDT